MLIIILLVLKCVYSCSFADFMNFVSNIFYYDSESKVIIKGSNYATLTFAACTETYGAYRIEVSGASDDDLYDVYNDGFFCANSYGRSRHICCKDNYHEEVYIKIVNKLSNDAVVGYVKVQYDRLWISILLLMIIVVIPSICILVTCACIVCMMGIIFIMSIIADLSGSDSNDQTYDRSMRK